MYDCIGRSKNQWESPVGCLMFSFTIQMEDGRIVPLLQYVVSLAITEAIKDVCYTNVSVFLDVYYSDESLSVHGKKASPPPRFCLLV